jgi:anti-sigma factor RsiW
MNDDDLWLDALLDDELDASASLALQRRLAAEPALQRRFEQRRELRDAVRGRATRHAAPDELRANLAALLATPAPTRGAARAGAGVTRERPSPHVRVALPWVTGVGGALLAVLGTLLAVDPAALGWHRTEALTALQTAEASEAVSAHTRALLVEHPIEVASSDQHTVRPWLSARLNFVPPVVDLAAQGFPLVGARRDVLSGQTAAALVYRHGAHVISVFVRPAEPNTPAGVEATRVVRGFNVIERTRGGLAFCFVSDVNPADLRTLADLVTSLAGR